ncbi:hypothetical protein ACVWW4_003946 [Bradyrhizobium sp. LB7.1]
MDGQARFAPSIPFDVYLCVKRCWAIQARSSTTAASLLAVYVELRCECPCRHPRVDNLLLDLATLPAERGAGRAFGKTQLVLLPSVNFPSEVTPSKLIAPASIPLNLSNCAISGASLLCCGVKETSLKQLSKSAIDSDDRTNEMPDLTCSPILRHRVKTQWLATDPSFEIAQRDRTSCLVSSVKANDHAQRM